jgi:hypothetical protein
MLSSFVLATVLAVSVPEPMTARSDDAAGDQGWLSPTALTQPANTVTIEVDELTVVRSTVTPHDRLQLTVAALLPLFGDGWLGSLTAKLRAGDFDRLHFSVLAGGGVASAITFIATRERFLSGGVAASFCGDASCGRVLSAYVLVSPTQATLPRGGDARTFARFIYGASLIIPVIPHIKVVTEANFTAEVHGDGDYQTSGHKYMTIVAGVRLHWSNLAATVGILGLYRWPWDGANGDSRSSQAVLPALSLGGRFGGS